MNTRKTDRRVKYTLDALKNALITLMQEEHISKISVKSLCELADVNRSTFYAHFHDQYDLLHPMEQEVLQNITKHLEQQTVGSGSPISFQVLSLILEYVQENAPLFKALLSDHCEPDIQREIMKLPDIMPVQIYSGLDTRYKRLSVCVRHHRLHQYPAKVASGWNAGVCRPSFTSDLSGSL